VLDPWAKWSKGSAELTKIFFETLYNDVVGKATHESGHAN
jgi:hypothetical protein